MKGNYIGEVNMLKATGQWMMITDYKNDNDITVTVYRSGMMNVDDAVTVSHVSYKDFLLGDLGIDIGYVQADHDLLKLK